ncbi:unnamed protein product [Cochlearia groenlandica]
MPLSNDCLDCLSFAASACCPYELCGVGENDEDADDDDDEDEDDVSFLLYWVCDVQTLTGKVERKEETELNQPA